MTTTISIYFIFFIYNLIKDLYITRKYLKNESLKDSIFISTSFFYTKQSYYYLLAFFINFILIILFLLPELFLNQVAFCMDEFQNSDTGSSTDDDISTFNEDLSSYQLDEESLKLNLEYEFERIFNKNINYIGYLSNSNKCFSNSYNFKIFKEINLELFSLKIKIKDILKTLSFSYNQKIENISIGNFIIILEDLNYNCHKLRFLFLKGYFDLNQNLVNVELDQLKNWANIFLKIPVFKIIDLSVYLIYEYLNQPFLIVRKI